MAWQTFYICQCLKCGNPGQYQFNHRASVIILYSTPFYYESIIGNSHVACERGRRHVITDFSEMSENWFWPATFWGTSHLKTVQIGPNSIFQISQKNTKLGNWWLRKMLHTLHHQHTIQKTTINHFIHHSRHKWVILMTHTWFCLMETETHDSHTSSVTVCHVTFFTVKQFILPKIH